MVPRCPPAGACRLAQTLARTNANTNARSLGAVLRRSVAFTCSRVVPSQPGAGRMPRKCARSGGCLRESHRRSTTPWSARGSRFARQCCAWQSVRCGPWRSTCRAELRQNWRTARMRQWSVVWSLASLPPFLLALASTVGFLATLLRGQQCGLTRRLSRRAYGTRLSSNVRPHRATFPHVPPR